MSDHRCSTAVKSCVVYAAFFALGSVGAVNGAEAGDDARKYDPLIAEFSEEHEVDPALVKAVIRAESAFDRKAVSRKGARGLMQLMPRVARRHGVSDPSDPRQNISAGVRLLRTLLDRYDNDRKLALAAYNAGGGAVERFGGLPPYRETRSFVKTVLRLRERYSRESLALDDGIDPDDDGSDQTTVPLLPARETWPRRAETIWYGAGRDSDGAALSAALHSPEDRLGVEPRSYSAIP